MPFTFSDKTFQVLVVEADAVAAENLAILFHKNFHVRFTTTLEEAEKLLDSNPPDLLICADDLPEESGLVFLERTHDRWPNTRKILMVPKVDGELFFNTMQEAPLLTFLEKPVEKTALHRALRNALHDPEVKPDEDIIKRRGSALNAPRKITPSSGTENPTADIIVLESDDKSAKNLARLIPREFQCRIFSTLGEAEQALDLNQPDIFICANEMSEENGLMFLQRTQHKWPGMHRILTVANPDGEFFFHAMNDAHISSFLTKPVKKSELLSRLRQALQESSADLDEDLHSEEDKNQVNAGVLRFMLLGVLLLLSSAGVFLVFFLVYHLKQIVHIGTALFTH